MIDFTAISQISNIFLDKKKSRSIKKRFMMYTKIEAKIDEDQVPVPLCLYFLLIFTSFFSDQTFKMDLLLTRPPFIT